MLKKQRKPAEIPVLGAESSEKPSETTENPLFDREKLGKPLGGVGGGNSFVALDRLSLAELLDLRAQIDELLPPRKLSEIDLEEEVALQFARTKKLYDTVAEDSKTPANQRAQVANSCTTILDQITKMQARLYSTERVKAMESAIIRALRELGDEKLQARFLEMYERALEGSHTAIKDRKFGAENVSIPKGAE